MKFQWPSHVKVVLFRGYDEKSTYCELWPPHAHEALVNNEDANEADSVHGYGVVMI